MFAAAAQHHPRVERAAIVPVPLSFGRRLEAPVEVWDGAGEEFGQKVCGTGWSADLDHRASHVIGRLSPAVLEERLIAGVGAGDLITHRVSRVLLGDRTGADDLVFRQLPIETRK